MIVCRFDFAGTTDREARSWGGAFGLTPPPHFKAKLRPVGQEKYFILGPSYKRDPKLLID